jgi:hypothetical protein
MVDPFASDFTPRILSRLQRGDHVMEARLIPHAQHVSIVILVDGRGALQGIRPPDLRWAEEQRVLHAGGDR